MTFGDFLLYYVACEVIMFGLKVLGHVFLRLVTPP